MIKLRTFNNGLSVVVVLLGLYIALAPFLPQLFFLFRDKNPSIIAPYAGALAEETGNTAPIPPPEDNRIVIPKLALNEPVEESNSITTLDDGGTWRRPNTSTPGSGNTVIIGHRFYRSQPSTFYHLDKLSIGDRIAVYWDGTEYLYEVSEVLIVSPNAVAIEAPTSDERLTLYTCTPLWTAQDRLVITALPVEEASQ